MEFNNQEFQSSFSLPNWKRISQIDHESHRFNWVKSTLSKHCVERDTLIDIGCGRQPFRSFVESLNVQYTGHDFAGYQDPNKENFGLHNVEIPLGKVDIVCDILDIPTGTKYDVVLCTEVFEHVPDPVQALAKIRTLISPGGVAIITFPGLSWTHQAPFFFSSGLSPYWINHHARNLNMEVIEGLAIGEMRDLLKFIMPNFEIGFSGLLLRALGSIYRFLVKRKIKVNYSANDSAILQNLVVLRCL